MEKKEIIAIVGGTGKEGKGLAYRWAKSGYEVIIGSRKLEKAQTAVLEIKELLDPEFQGFLSGAENFEAVKPADIVVLTIPYQFHKDMLLQLKPHMNGKTFLDVTVPLVPPRVSVITIPENERTTLDDVIAIYWKEESL